MNSVYIFPRHCEERLGSETKRNKVFCTTRGERATKQSPSL